MSTIALLNPTNRRSEKVPVEKILLKKRQREVDTEHVAHILDSYQALGDLQIQDIVLNQDYVLVDGAHRLQAAKDAGWTHIDAIIVEGLTEEDRQLVEAEANRIRKALSPIELELTWRTYYEPRYKALAQKKQASSLIQNQKSTVTVNPGNREVEEGEFTVTGIYGNGEGDAGEFASTEGRINFAELAKQSTGISKDTLDKVSQIRLIAESEDVSESLRESALIGLKKLERPGAPVEPVFKALMKLVEAEERQRMTVEQREVLASQQLFHKLIDVSTSLAIQLDQADLAQYVHLASVDPAGYSNVRSVAYSLAAAIADLVAVEGLGSVSPAVLIHDRIEEISRMIADRAIEKAETFS